MRIHNLYADANGESHFRDIEVEWAEERRGSKLSSFGIELDRTSLGPLCEQNLGAEQVAKCLIEAATFKRQIGKSHIRQIENCVARLWERWFPDQPSFETLDAKMQAGYGLWLKQHEVVAACAVWLDAWRDFLSLLDKSGSQSIDEFDAQFKGTEWVYNWLQEFEQELWNAGIEQHRFFSDRVRVCEENLRRFPSDNALAIENRRRYLAESYFELGDTAKTEALYREWLAADPQWGWGWTGWADCHYIAKSATKDLKKAEQILLDGMAVDGVRDIDALIERLAHLYEDQGRKQEAQQLYRRLPVPERVAQSTATKPTATTPKVGRNDPCPCGSGKKFKKCCGSVSAGV